MTWTSTSTPEKATTTSASGLMQTRGLLFLNHRTLDPKLALLTQPDWFEVTRPGVRTNHYSYAGDDLVNGSDAGANVFGDCFKSQTESNNASASLFRAVLTLMPTATC